jgi:NTP pyrophosphatase (non-canonical NTP hydrolase)
MTLREFQKRIEELYYEKDARRGGEATFRWFVEEVGELARAIRKGEGENLREEFADCLAWLSTLASLCDVDLSDAATARYGAGCPRCGRVPCGCTEPPGLFPGPGTGEVV